jgi:hypothetical protein
MVDTSRMIGGPAGLIASTIGSMHADVQLLPGDMIVQFRYTHRKFFREPSMGLSGLVIAVDDRNITMLRTEDGVLALYTINNTVLLHVRQSSDAITPWGISITRCAHDRC